MLLFIAVLLKTGDWKGLVFAVLLFAGTLAIEWLDRSYRVSYDGEAVYMRPHGITWTLARWRESRIAFADIVAATAEWGARSPRYDNHFTPFEFVQLHGQRENDEPVSLVGGELYGEDLRELLAVIETRAPGTLDDDVRAWLASNRRF
ncbi:hypothetical protein [Sphingomonas rubra]|uniref:hypothetical protein n=1 Tax=Sphingomonas rubra TaxID=634430 RepID=UPI001160DEBA|nr:hypothetical protein [Sphingomonas rubra]